MPLFRRRDETLNEQLLREAGYSPDGTTVEAQPTERREPEPVPSPALQTSGERDAHVVATVEVPELVGESYEFTTLPDGSLIVDDSCDQDLSRLADAVEEHLERPYRASATRNHGDLWVVAARRIEVGQFAAEGDELELTSVAGQRTYTVDGRSVDQALAPAGLAAFGEARSDDYAVHAIRLDADLWEIEADPL